MHPFERLVYDRFADSIGAWDTLRHPDIYAVSFLYETGWTSDAEGDEVMLQGLVSLSYNTLSRYEEQIAQARDAAEAKWNFAFWLQEVAAQVPRFLEPEYGTDPDKGELAVRDAWCAARGIAPTGSDGAGLPTYGAGFEEAIVAAYGRVARELHQSGAIVRKLGRPVPVIIHTLTYGRAGLEATRASNPAALVAEFFSAWADGG
jgi:hypothetical protein